MVPGERIELSTQGFSILCSTTELPRHEVQGDFNYMCEINQCFLEFAF